MIVVKYSSAARWLARAAFGVAVALAVSAAGGGAFARDCAPTIKPGNGYKGQIEMPPARYWVRPGHDYKTLDCDEITAIQRDASNRDCHLLGFSVPKRVDALGQVFLASYAVEIGDVVICRGLTGVSKTMVLIHEYAHRAGWKHGTGKFYTVKAWLADPRVPNWAKE